MTNRLRKDEHVMTVAARDALDADMSRLRAELSTERDRTMWLAEALRKKDEAMGVLFDRLAKAGVDCSDLVS